LLLLHLVGCLYYCISDARSHKHQTTVSIGDNQLHVSAIYIAIFRLSTDS